MDAIINPVLLYLGLAAGAVGVAMALPRPRVSPQIIGAIIAAAGFGAIFLGLGLKAYDSPEGLPGAFFYIFALIALGSALRVVSHPRPVYAALYFILTILASSALYLLMQAEFMAFALIIIYAGAILITYLFVIMLATQAPTEDQVEALSEYDISAREPIVATGVGFALLAVLSSMIASGVGGIRQAPTEDAIAVARFPGEIIRRLNAIGLDPSMKDFTQSEHIQTLDGTPAREDWANELTVPIASARLLRDQVRSEDPKVTGWFDASELQIIRETYLAGDELLLRVPQRYRSSDGSGAAGYLERLEEMGIVAGIESPSERAIKEAMTSGELVVIVTDPKALILAMPREIQPSPAPSTLSTPFASMGVMEVVSERDKDAILLSVADDGHARIALPGPLELSDISNIQRVGWSLVAEHPMALELAGVILLMAMLGAVVLARKQIELGEDEKARAVHTIGEQMEDIA